MALRRGKEDCGLRQGSMTEAQMVNIEIDDAVGGSSNNAGAKVQSMARISDQGEMLLIPRQVVAELNRDCQQVNIILTSLDKKMDNLEKNIDQWFDKLDDSVSDFNMSIRGATYDFDVFKSRTMSTTLLLEVSESNVFFPVNNVVLKDTPIGSGLQKPLQRSQYRLTSNKIENKNQGREPGYNHVEHSKLTYDGLPKQHLNGVKKTRTGIRTMTILKKSKDNNQSH
ncbi:unnamed protein product [Linum trigynum]|uniref:Uncharacterized protein n=1 Tax=Linum trigynum TaxID=586398 RepID=A0AAV2DNI0_9ROSI